MYITYQQVKPTAALQPYVDCFWLQNFEGTADEISPIQTCIPVGMLEIIVQLDNHTCDICINGVWQTLPRIFLAGMYQESVMWRANSNARKFGMRLKPETFQMIFEMPPAVVFSNFTVLHNIVGNAADYLVEKLSAQATMQQVVTEAEHFLLQQIRKHKENFNYVTAAARLIRSTKGSMDIDELCKSVYVSPRQLQRSFRNTIGTGPKTYMRIIRFRNAFAQMQH